MPIEASAPPVNIYRANGQLSVALPIPGAHPEHVELRLTPTRLRLRANCKYPQEQQSHRQREWQVGAWAADVLLPESVDPAAARATLRHGVLVVMAPVSGAAGGERAVAVD